jgi:hypothetical protein
MHFFTSVIAKCQIFGMVGWVLIVMMLLQECLGTILTPFIGLAYQGKDIVFRFILEYSSSLWDFGPPR